MTKIKKEINKKRKNERKKLKKEKERKKEIKKNKKGKERKKEKKARPHSVYHVPTAVAKSINDLCKRVIR